MVKNAARWDGEGTVAVFILCVFSFLFFLLTPSERWLEVSDTIQIESAHSWEYLDIDYKRTIKRDFEGGYRCNVRKVYGEGLVSLGFGDWVYGPYRTDSKLPDPLDTKWLCFRSVSDDFALAPGEYELCVDWKINPTSLILRRYTSACGLFQIIQG